MIPAIPHDAVVAEARRLVASLGILPQQIGAHHWQLHAGISTRTLERHGGLRAVLREAFPQAFSRDPGAYGATARNAYVASLERNVGRTESLRETLSAAVSRAVRESVMARKPLPHKAFPRPRAKPRVVVALMSDTHFGLTINPAELPGAPAYGWAVACRRMAHFAEQIATYKPTARGSTTELRLCLGGDIIQGIIHWMSDSGQDHLANQVAGAVHILVSMLDYLRRHFPRIVVTSVPGNHERRVHKGPDRAHAQTWDSSITDILAGVRVAFRKAPDVVFHTPDAPVATFSLFGHKYVLLHGDSMVRAGNPGRVVNIQNITTQIMRMAEGVAPRARVVMMGHVHVPLLTTLDNGTDLLINGSGSGADAYARSLGIYSAHPTQIIFEATGAHPVGDVRFVRLAQADGIRRLDTIIPTFRPRPHGDTK